MGKGHRRGRKQRKQMRIVVGASICLLFIMVVGYAAFQTNLNITAKGNVSEKIYTTAELKSKYCNATSGDGLYVDTYENDRCVYKGANPNNYITFNNEEYRIVSVESDETLKIIRNERLDNTMAWDTSNSNDWARPVTLNSYLNDESNPNSYYNSLSDEAKSQIKTHTWDIGGVNYTINNMATNMNQEKSNKWSGNIALIGVTDYVKASTNSLCTTVNQYYYNINPNCYNNSETHNWMYKPSYAWWTLPFLLDSSYMHHVMLVTINAHLSSTFAEVNTVSVRPALYLKSDITLSGEGTQTDPYVIESQ